MSSTVQVGKRTFTTDTICEQLSSSDLLPQLIREMIIDEILAEWEIEIDHKIPYSREEFAEGCDRLGKLPGYQGLNHLQLYRIVDRHLRLQKFKQARWTSRVYSYFLQRKDNLDRIKFSLIEVDSLGLAEELFFRVQRGEQSFADLAFKYSQGDAARDGGRIDAIAIDQTYPAIATYLRSLKEGEISPIFTLGNLYAFVRLERRILAELNDSLRQILIDELFDTWVQQQISTRLGLFEIQDSVDLPELSQKFDTNQIKTVPVGAIDEQPEVPEVIEPNASFFFPKLTSELNQDLDEQEDRVGSSSFFVYQARPTQIINNSSAFSGNQKVLSFLIFLWMFLGLEVMTTHMFHRLVIPQVNVGSSQIL